MSVRKLDKEATTRSMYEFPAFSSEQVRRLWNVTFATLTAYGLLPADWLFWASQALEQSHKRGSLGATEAWLTQLEGKLGVHLLAQLAYGVAHRDEVDGMVLMVDALIRLKRRKRTDPRDHARFQDHVAPYLKVVDCTSSSLALKKRVSSTWSSKPVPPSMTEGAR